MSAREALQALIEHVEAGKAPKWWFGFIGKPGLWRRYVEALGLEPKMDSYRLVAAALNGSLDAAVALAERVLGDNRAVGLLGRIATQAWANRRPSSSLALALVLAVCRAKLAEMPE